MSSSFQTTRVAAPRPNPFSTQRIRPGSLKYLFTEGETAESLVQRLEQCGWRGEILGPHGCGKSTLLRSLLAPLEEAGRRVEWFVLQAGQHSLSAASDSGPCPPWLSWDRRTQVVIDGYEQLAWRHRWRIRSLCRLRKAGLLVTTHAPAGFPSLLQIHSSEATAQRVVAALLGSGANCISSHDVAKSYRRCGGDVRETLFDLYDVWERRCRAD